MTGKHKYYVFVFCLLANILSAQESDSLKTTYYYSLQQLSELNIITGSIKAESQPYAPSNITVITKEMIADRGYLTLVDICQDIPGFDFMMYNDAGGEYPSYSMHRGLGEIGNSEILIMIDGIVQNQISFNWSLLWTYEGMLIDVERIEIIHGPVSVIFGAQAFSGVINIITDNDFNGAKVKTSIGSYNTQVMDIFISSKKGKNIKSSVSFHKYSTEGDKGIDRYDPGNYFSNTVYPETILADYDSSGTYVENTQNPKAGDQIANGFNTLNNSLAIRADFSYKNTQLGFFISDSKRGYASELVSYEYDLTNPYSYSHYRSYLVFIRNKYNLNSKFNIESNAVFRGTHILPDGGAKYLYRFPELAKRYACYSYQGFLEERLSYSINSKNNLSFGIKGAISQKTERVSSLGGQLLDKRTTNSSWDFAVDGLGINQIKRFPSFLAKEFAAYGLWDFQLTTNVSASTGLRFDYGSEFGAILNPRFAIDYNPLPEFGVKGMYGEAFRQPSIFEITSEFRGNPYLKSQKIRTSEFEINSAVFDSKTIIKLNLFYSIIEEQIGKVTDSTMPAGERYENIGDNGIAGFSAYLSSRISRQIFLYSNYCLLKGYTIESNTFFDINRTARHKINAGINIKLLTNKMTADFRMNYVGKRKAQETNTWLQTYSNGYAPDYMKFNFSVSYQIVASLSAQLVLNNVFNAKYYGVGWETGSAFIDDYNFQSNVNPKGHIPSYHPQPGRTWLFSLIFNINGND